MTHGLRLTLSLAVLLLAGQGGYATWAKISDQDLIDQSVLIVKASLMGKTTVKLAGQRFTRRLAVLKVQQVYKGEATEVVLLALPNRAPGIVVSSDIDYPVGQTGIWFLRLDPVSQEGIYLADNPQRLWPEQRERRLQELLGSEAG